MTSSVWKLDFNYTNIGASSLQQRRVGDSSRFFLPPHLQDFSQVASSDINSESLNDQNEPKAKPLRVNLDWHGFQAGTKISALVKYFN